ncbi:MAG: bifunctional UDP-N-acetylglucosamine diphosphorylase/glucosamine-1-phosphate N-acetyltransferase GlmU [Beijerinckiaceae bacterium]
MSSNKNAAHEPLAVILAAGEGTRMRSRHPKVLQKIAGRSMLGHVLAAVESAGIRRVAVVIAPDRDEVAADIRSVLPQAEVFLQHERRGTAHATLAARAAIEQGASQTIVLFGDTPFVSPDTLKSLRDAVIAGSDVVGVGFRAVDPTGYGRFIMKNGELVDIREHKDASDEERAITLCNGGLMAFGGNVILPILEAVGSSNAQSEFYLTDAPAIAHARGLKVSAIECPEQDVLGINDRAQLAAAEAIMQQRLRARVMRDGATLIAPEAVFLSFDTKVGRDVVIEPNVIIGPGVTIEDDVVVRAFSHLEGAHVSASAQVGPYARLRPGAKLGPKSRIGNFVEVKNAEIGAGAKANHLAYIGDASVGANSNIGAGVITCNYDGFNKTRTTIGEGAFVGTNSSLVAPVTIGDGAYIGSGSVITRDVPKDALAVGRGRQEMREGWAAAWRKRYAHLKKKDH